MRKTNQLIRAQDLGLSPPVLKNRFSYHPYEDTHGITDEVRRHPASSEHQTADAGSAQLIDPFCSIELANLHRERNSQCGQREDGNSFLRKYKSQKQEHEQCPEGVSSEFSHPSRK